MTGVSQMPALTSANGVSPEPRMKLPRGALASIREPGPTSSSQVALATPLGSRLALIRPDQGQPTKQRVRAARTLLYRAPRRSRRGEGVAISSKEWPLCADNRPSRPRAANTV